METAVCEYHWAQGLYNVTAYSFICVTIIGPERLLKANQSSKLDLFESPDSGPFKSTFITSCQIFITVKNNHFSNVVGQSFA